MGLPSTRSHCCLVLLALQATVCYSTVAHGQTKELTAKVLKKDLKLQIEVPGVFVAEDKDELRVEPKEYKGELIVTKIEPEGVTVKQGDVLMEFEADNLDKAIEDAKSEVTDAEIAMKKAEAEFKSAEIDAETAVTQLTKELDFAQREVDAATELESIELSKKEEGLEAMIRGLADAEVDFEQLKELYQERELHTATEDILIEREEHKIKKIKESIERTTKELAHFKKFEKAKEAMTKEIEVAKKQAELKKKEIQVEADLSEKKSLVAKAKRKLDREQKKLADLEADKLKLRIVSPRDGVLFYRTTGGDNPAGVVVFGRNNSNELRVGGRVKTHSILLTVATMDTLSVKMQVLENDIQHMKKGLPMTVRPDAFPAMALEGQLTKVDQIASRTGIFSEVRRFTVKGSYEGGASQLR